MTPDSLIKVTGRTPLAGHYPVQGSKNIALHLYAAVMLTDAPVTLHNAPAIVDTGVCARILQHTGMGADFDGSTFTTGPAAQMCPVIHPAIGHQVRTTAVLAAAVLARTGIVSFPYPGGDAFCPRLIDRHLAAMQAAGADIITSDTGVRAFTGTHGVRPFTVDVNTPYGPSLGATVTAMLLAARAEGTSLITSPSIEPEVTETARFLSERGVGIAFDAGSLTITGTDYIPGGTFTIAGDRIEAATVAMAAAATGGNVTLDGINLTNLPDGLTIPLAKAGLTLTQAAGPHMRAAVNVAPGPLTAIETQTGPHPGLPTDTAPQLAAMLTQAQGTSLLRERIYPQRDTHVNPLQAFGANIHSTGSLIRIRGGTPLRAAEVEAADIRAVTALLIAALAADGTSTIRGLHHLRRGYGHLLDGLATLGAEISTEPED
ncbi:UDP-N-acetylglucosamine 1-carboxyvinyltransferase [Streptomyces sp. APSN-46.1]|uniref:UDP-N-acetylglucosamine 1-carboxyvinyltransferase n=1 Tax=Streptomyces sp. APSN-46.1 TaxID=2929049 RepID=UPI001FB3810C|nr:UDP-N-acetylglucosamine 1-carboxyvinyltransferase [Streptomyces sp. APSN-46.1]MCJ1678520.1 UDP-N-acetylglucosamine 1-carboxyvinyltransferase [Streptomyces sp. APSN-46.1]